MPAKGKYRYMGHTADVMYEAYGQSFEKALENAALALFEVIADTRKIRAAKKVELREKAETLEDLAGFVLSDLNSESDAREIFFKRMKAGKLERTKDGYSIGFTAEGEPYSVEKGRSHVKAVTKHETQVEEKGGKWRIRILLDI
ncbi:MAG: archease [Candidatus Micrarchaeota archaeon]